MKKNKQSFGQLLFGEDKDIEQVLQLKFEIEDSLLS